MGSTRSRPQIEGVKLGRTELCSGRGLGAVRQLKRPSGGPGPAGSEIEGEEPRMRLCRDKKEPKTA